MQKCPVAFWSRKSKREYEVVREIVERLAGPLVRVQHGKDRRGWTVQLLDCPYDLVENINREIDF